MRARPPVHRGLTLLEVLAVVVIVSLVSAATMVGLASANDDAAFRAARACVHDLDVKARLLARTGTPVALTTTADQFLCIVGLGDSSVRLAHAAMPAQVAVDLTIGGENVPHVLFDRLGRSDDYAVVMRTHNRTERWMTGGLTGWMLREGDTP